MGNFWAKARLHKTVFHKESLMQKGSFSDKDTFVQHSCPSSAVCTWAMYTFPQQYVFEHSILHMLFHVMDFSAISCIKVYHTVALCYQGQWIHCNALKGEAVKPCCTMCRKFTMHWIVQYIVQWMEHTSHNAMHSAMYIAMHSGMHSAS